MKKRLVMPPNCIRVTSQHRDTAFALIGTGTHGDGFVDALRKAMQRTKDNVTTSSRSGNDAENDAQLNAVTNSIKPDRRK